MKDKAHTASIISRHNLFASFLLFFFKSSLFLNSTQNTAIVIRSQTQCNWKAIWQFRGKTESERTGCGIGLEVDIEKKWALVCVCPFFFFHQLRELLPYKMGFVWVPQKSSTEVAYQQLFGVTITNNSPRNHLHLWRSVVTWHLHPQTGRYVVCNT